MLGTPAGSDADGASDSVQVQKRRRVQRACDMCRLKKVRCEGGLMSRKACSNCVTEQYDCTYIQTSQNTFREKAYIQSLEARLHQTEGLLRKLHPDIQLSPESMFTDRMGSSDEHLVRSSESLRRTTIPVDSDDEDEDDSEDEFAARQTLESALKHVSLDPGQPYYFGKSSSLTLIHTTLDAKGTNHGQKSDYVQAEIPIRLNRHNRLPGLRHYFVFPPDDLTPILVDIYFREYNIFLPLLHRPSFERSIADNLHLRDEGFGSTVLLVCALAARFSEDSRVSYQEVDGPKPDGWQWFSQVQATQKLIALDPPRLYDLQISFLASSYLHCSPTPELSWPIIGTGIRLAQALGAHRRKTYEGPPSVEKELLKRAFWCLVYLDRNTGHAFGRPCCMQDEDIDADLPIECDDEYWTNDRSETAFCQPKDKHSIISYFICTIRLNRILGLVLHNMYPITKGKGSGELKREEQMVAELDSALNKWLDSIPEHLRWNPDMESMTFLSLSATLYANYHNVQITIHRPFLSARKSSTSAFPSLAICTRAARSCLSILDIQYKRSQAEGNFQQLPQVASLFNSGMVLLLNIWAARRSGLTVNIDKESAEIHKAVHMLMNLEHRLHVAGRMGDALYELAKVTDLPVPKYTPSTAPKRPRESGDIVYSPTTPHHVESASESAGMPHHEIYTLFTTLGATNNIRDNGVFPTHNRTSYEGDIPARTIQFNGTHPSYPVHVGSMQGPTFQGNEVNQPPSSVGLDHLATQEPWQSSIIQPYTHYQPFDYVQDTSAESSTQIPHGFNLSSHDDLTEFASLFSEFTNGFIAPNPTFTEQDESGFAANS